MASAVDVMEHAWKLPYPDGKLGERMQFGALGSTVHGPEVTVNLSVFGGSGDGGGDGGGDGDGGGGDGGGGEGGGEGGGGNGGGGGGSGYEHTRQPV